MIWKLMGARWLFRRQCVKLQAVLTLIEEFLDLGCLYVFKLCFEVFLGSVFKFFLYDHENPTGIRTSPAGLSSVALLGLLFLLAVAGCW